MAKPKPQKPGGRKPAAKAKVPQEPRKLPAPSIPAAPAPDDDPLEPGLPWDQLSSDERSPLRTYLDEIGKTPLLTLEEETALARRVLRGDEEARGRMIKANLRLVVRIAKDYDDFGLPLMDLISEGNFGLIKAIERFDPDKGGKLSTYAAWWIKQAIKRALASNGKTIRLPVHMVDRIGQMRRTANRLAAELGREPYEDEIAQAMDLPVAKIVHMRSVANRAASLDQPIGEDGEATLGDLVKDEGERSPFESLRSKSDRREIADLLARLEPREADIMNRRFGLDGESPLTLEEIGARFKLTRERVRQLQQSALMKLRRIMTERQRLLTPEDVRRNQLADARAEVLREFFRSKGVTESDPRSPDRDGL